MKHVTKSNRLRWAGAILALPLLAATYSALSLPVDWPAGSGKQFCLDCHAMHNTVGGGFALGKFTTVINLCQSCHAEAAANPSAPDVTTHQGFKCTVCHEPHLDQGSNLLHVRLSVDTPNSGLQPVVFTDNTLPQPTGFADFSSPHNGICEVCHTTTSYHRNDGTGVSHNQDNAGQVCTDCHTHLDGFLASGDDCISCHGTEKGSGTFAAGTRRRPIIGTSGDFQNSIGGHMSGSDPTNFECVVCHMEGQIVAGEVKVDSNFHNAGVAPYTVDLRDVDAAGGQAATPFAVRTDPTSWPATTGPNGTLGSPTNVYKNNMSQFCLGCHDSNGASQTFSQRPSGGGSATTPFGTGNGSPLDTLSQFTFTNFSSHNINSFRAGTTPKNADQMMAGAMATGWASNSITECADCHLGRDTAATPTYYHNGHGGRNLKWMMADKNGADQAFPTAAGDQAKVASNLTCLRCHNPETYGTDGSSLTLSRYPAHNRGGDHQDQSRNIFDIACMNCHGGAEVGGGIHGTNLTITDDDGAGSYNAYRFTNGAALDYWTLTMSGRNTNQRTCSVKSTTTGTNINCTQHSSRTYTVNGNPAK